MGLGQGWRVRRAEGDCAGWGDAVVVSVGVGLGWAGIVDQESRGDVSRSLNNRFHHPPGLALLVRWTDRPRTHAPLTTGCSSLPLLFSAADPVQSEILVGYPCRRGRSVQAEGPADRGSHPMPRRDPSSCWSRQIRSAPPRRCVLEGAAVLRTTTDAVGRGEAAWRASTHLGA